MYVPRYVITYVLFGVQAVHWVTPSKVMVVRSFEVLAAYILQVKDGSHCNIDYRSVFFI